MLTNREYGANGPTVVVLHGGPGAAGYMAPVARRLASQFHVLEPFQRKSSSVPLTVADHVEDLHELLSNRTGNRTAIVGSSWGAMLALAFAAEYPTPPIPIALVGCGTFDPLARQEMHDLIEERMTPGLTQEVRRLESSILDLDERMWKIGELLLPIYSHELITTHLEMEQVDAKGHQEAWNDMLRLQNEKIYPQAFSKIRSSVLMLHGDFDPHPGSMIRKSLKPFIKQLQFRALERCGHYPWLEVHARDAFFEILIGWLKRQLNHST